MAKLADRVKETTSTTGTGTYSLGGAVTGFRAFSSAFVTTDTVYYVAENGVDWEIGIGTLTTGTPWTLARTTILSSSNAGSAVNWGAGTKNVFCDAPAARLDNLSDSFDKAKAYLSGASSTTNVGWQKINLDAVEYDAAGMWDGTNKRLYPKRAGYYLCTGRARWSATSGTMILAIGKNGGGSIAMSSEDSVQAMAGSALIYCNGTTDYLDLRAYTTTASALTTGTFDTFLQVVGPF